MNTNDFKIRWTSPAGQAVKLQVIEAIRRGSDWATLLAGFPGADEIPYHEDLRGIHITDEVFSNATLRFASCDYAVFERCDLSDCDFQRSRLTGVQFIDCKMTDAHLFEVDGSHIEMTKCDLKNVKAMRAHIPHIVASHCDMSGISLCCAMCRDGRFLACNCQDADFESADLRGADFTRSLLRNVKVHGALLDDAMLSQ